MAYKEEFVVFSSPKDELVKRNVALSIEDCKAIELLVKYEVSKPEIPTPSEFMSVVAPLVLERTHDEVSPFPKLTRMKIASRILRGGKVYQWRRLIAGKNYPTLQPFNAWRGSDGVVVQFIDPKTPLRTVAIPYCRKICVTSAGTCDRQLCYQCSCFGSYSQIELRAFLPYWIDMCSAESAQTCPMRLATGMPKPDPKDPVIKAFQKWCKTRKGYKKP